jgi:Lipocalin-like domain
VSDVPDIYGVWRLQSYYLENMETAERTEVFGPKPNGVLILLPEGRMAAIITPTEQRQPTTEADEASAFRNLITYSGLYRLEPPDRFVTTVDVAWVPAVDGLAAGTQVCAARRHARDRQ